MQLSEEPVSQVVVSMGWRGQHASILRENLIRHAHTVASLFHGGVSETNSSASVVCHLPKACLEWDVRALCRSDRELWHFPHRRIDHVRAISLEPNEKVRRFYSILGARSLTNLFHCLSGMFDIQSIDDSFQFQDFFRMNHDVRGLTLAKNHSANNDKPTDNPLPVHHLTADEP